LKATIHFQLDTDLNSTATCIGPGIVPGQACELDGQSCFSFCNLSSYGLSFVSPNSWNVYAVMRATWDYSSLNGQIVARNQPDANTNIQTEYLIPLFITWNGTNWHITSGDPSCVVAQAWIQENSNLGTVTINNQAQQINWQYISGATPAEGCLLETTLGNSFPSQTTSNSQTVYCLYQFGILLAANDLAHQYWPNLLMADAYEQNSIQHLLSQEHQ
jgi:hypothetical protein